LIARTLKVTGSNRQTPAYYHTDFADSSVKAVNNNENRMVVSLDLNNVTYQGVLFAQPINVSQSHSIQR